jgi:hypothetical protein
MQPRSPSRETYGGSRSSLETSDTQTHLVVSHPQPLRKSRTLQLARRIWKTELIISHRKGRDPELMKRGSRLTKVLPSMDIRYLLLKLSNW